MVFPLVFLSNLALESVIIASLLFILFFSYFPFECIGIEKMSKRGAFILFEGIDRCGKSTQVSLLTEQLAAASVASENIRFPDRTSTIGQMINSYLASTTDMDDRTIHLLFSANRWEASSSIEKKLKDGNTLICDRYAYSGVAFTGAKGYDLEWCKAPDSGLPRPDAIIYLDMPVEEVGAIRPSISFHLFTSSKS